MESHDLRENIKASSHILMPLLNTPFQLGHCLESVQLIDDTQDRAVALGEYYYFTGQHEEAVKQMEPYLANEDTALRLSASLVSAYANLATGHIFQAKNALAQMEKTFSDITGNKDASPEQKAMAVFVSTTASVLLHLPVQDEHAFDASVLTMLPPGLRFFACYVKAHYAYLQGEYSRSLGNVEMALAFQQQIYPVPTIYLRLIAVMDYMALKDTDKAKEQMLLAWDIARPDGLIEAFGEHHGLLGGALEATLKKDWPKEFKRIINITYNFSSGWRKIHNPVTGEDVADNLTTTEFAIAMLAAHGWSNQEIAEHMDLKTSTVKWYVSIILDKLNVEKRDDLLQYMLS